MANKVLLKKSSTATKVPLVTDLDYGELALNYTDGKLYYKTASNTIDSIPSISATATLTNKTLTSPTINGGALSGTFSGAITLSDATASTSTTTGALKIGGGLGVAGAIYADQIRLTNNGAGTNVYIGDDVVLGDINTANTLGVRGIQDAAQGYLVFGNANSTNYIGRSGTNPLQVTGQFKVDSGTVTGTDAVALQIAGYANKGGTGYHDFLKVTNSYGSATNINKFFRLNSTGNLEIINSAYTANLFTITDAGVVSFGGTAFPNSQGTNGQVLTTNGAGTATWTSIAGGGGTTTNALTIGTGLSGTSFNGSSAVTIAIDSTVATLTGSQTLTNKTLSSATLTGTLTASSSAGTSGQVLSSTGSGVQWINPPWPTATYTALAEFGSTSITTETSVYSFAIATYRTAKYIIQITNGTAYNSLEVLVSHNGTNVWIATNSSSYATNDPSAGSYFDGNYINLALREGDIQIGTINAGIRFYISAGNLIFAATAISGTISVKGQVTLIKV